MACQARKEAIDAPDGVESGSLRPQSIFHLRVVGRDDPNYWLFLEIPARSKLLDLDYFLRAIWLECCGHLSSFDIDEETFFSTVMEPGDKSMKYALEKVMAPGMTVEYMYDFGSSTELLITVMSARIGNITGKKVDILARNDPPDMRCSLCGKTATFICSECSCSDAVWLCDECGKDHKCGTDMLLPVVNSPRVGVCAFEGGYYD